MDAQLGPGVVINDIINKNESLLLITLLSSGAMRRPPRGASDVLTLRAPAGLLRDARLRPAAANVPRPVRPPRLRRRRRVRLDWQDHGKQFCSMTS